MAANKRTQQEVILKYLVEQSTQAKVEAANNAIKQSLVDIKKAAEVGGAVGASEMRRLAKSTKKLQKELLETEDGFSDIGSQAPRELQDVIDKVERLNKELAQSGKQVNKLDEEFGKVSKDVALAGDVESQARTIGGGIGALGGRQAEQAIGTISELPAVIEALPKFKASLAGMPAAIDSAAKSIGVPGGGLGLTVALAGFTVVALAAREATKRLEDETRRGVATRKFAADVQSQSDEELKAAALEQQRIITDSTNAINANSDAFDTALATRRKENLEITAGGINVIATARKIGQEFDLVADNASIVIDAQNGYNNELKTAEANLATVNAEMATRNIGLEDEGKLLEQINERNNRVIENARIEGREIRTRNELSKQSTEQLNERNEAITEEIRILEIEQQRIRDNVDITKDAINVLTEYEKTLITLRDEQAFINESALGLAKTREEEATQTQALADEEDRLARNRRQSLLETSALLKANFAERARIEQEHADALIAISEKAAEESVRALDKLENKLADLNRDLGRDLDDQQRKANRKSLEAQIEAQREQVQDLTDHTRTLQDIRRKADEDEFGLRQSRDFKAVFNARRQARIAIQDQQRDFVREQTDKNKERQQDINDRNREFAEERADRLRKFEQATSDARQQFAIEQSLAVQNAQNAIMIRRAQFTQELTDLQQSGLAALQLRRSLAEAELGIVRNLAANVGQLFGQIGQSFGSFGASQTTVSNTNTTNNLGGFQINAAEQQAQSIAESVIGIFQGLVA